ncbi:MAG: DoxX family membrane protein [Planctomycetes bacterium]|nr:DoxX family membrane protein [Planctomycetota bacterium]
MNLLVSLVLRLSLGVMFVFAFLGKIGDRTLEGLDKYTTNLDVSKLEGTAEYITRTFEGKLPNFLVSPYATLLPWVELVTGVLLLLGLMTRTTFGIVAATLASLAFGQVILGDIEKVVQIGCYMSAALAGVIVMGQVKQGGGKILGLDDLFGGKVTID